LRNVAWLVGIACVLSVAVSCAPPSSPPAIGVFAIEMVSTAALGSAEGEKAVSIGNVSVDSSQSVFFILRNVGDAPIYNVEFWTTEATSGANAGEDFTITPNSISELDPESTASVFTLVRVDVNHGSIYGKVGAYNYISPAVSGASIQITGSSLPSTTSPVEPVIATLSTLIRLAAWEVQYSNDTGASWTTLTCDLPNEYGFAQTYNAGVDPISLANVIQASTLVRIVNSGNVPLTIVAMSNNAVDQTGLVIQSGASSPPNHMISGGGGGSRLDYVISTGGTVFDNSEGTTLGFQFVPGTSNVALKVL
jgi:hypothetical protein